MAIGIGIASLVLAVGGTVVQTRDKNRQIADMKEIDATNASNLALENKESARRLDLSNKKTAGLLKAYSASTGFASGGSTTGYINNVIGEGQKDLDWMKTSGRSRLGILRSEANARLRLTKASASAGVVAGVGNAIGSGVSAYGAAGGTF